MKCSSATRSIVITNTVSGYQVEVAPKEVGVYLDRWFEEHEHKIAKAYALGLSEGTGWSVSDSSTAVRPGEFGDGPMIIVEQINRTQWHVVDPDDLWTIGDVHRPLAVAEALHAATQEPGSGVVSISLDGDRLVLLRPGCAA